MELGLGQRRELTPVLQYRLDCTGQGCWTLSQLQRTVLAFWLWGFSGTVGEVA